MRQIRLLCHDILDLPNGLLVQQTIFSSYSQRQWHVHRIEVARDSDQAGMAGDCGIDTANGRSPTTLFLPVGLQYGVPTAPAKANSSNLVGSWYHADGVDEAIDDGLRDCLPMLDKPWTQRTSHNGTILDLADRA